jgi:hypothetical protein
METETEDYASAIAHDVNHWPLEVDSRVYTTDTLPIVMLTRALIDRLGEKYSIAPVSIRSLISPRSTSVLGSQVGVIIRRNP